MLTCGILCRREGEGEYCIDLVRGVHKGGNVRRREGRVEWMLDVLKVRSSMHEPLGSVSTWAVEG